MADDKKKKTKRPTALKRDIQNAKRRLQNRSFKSRLNTELRAFNKNVSEKNGDEAKSQLNNLYALLDKAVKRNIFSINKASRLKSKYAARV